MREQKTDTVQSDYVVTKFRGDKFFNTKIYLTNVVTKFRGDKFFNMKIYHTKIWHPKISRSTVFVTNI